MAAPPPPESTDLLVIGAGPAGLSAAAAARERGLGCIVLEAGDAPGGMWRRVEPDLLCLSPRRYDRLPDGSIPLGASAWATAAEVLSAWQAYAARQRFDVRYGHRAATLDPSTLTVHTARGAFTGRAVVVATGQLGRPVRPALPGRFEGPQDHSSTLDLGTVADRQTVLVVGTGNSAVDLVPRILDHGAACIVAARSPLSRPPRPPGRLGSALRWRLSAIPTRKLPWALRCGPHVPVVDPILSDLREQRRIVVVGEVTALEPSAVIAGGRPVACDRIVWATGFRRDLDWLGIPLDEGGVPEHREGVSGALPALGFLGLQCQRTRRSGFLRGFADDARSLVDRLLPA